MTDGVVLPVLHLNGYKIANPAVLARIPEDELVALMRGYGYDPHFVVGDDPAAVHEQLAATLDGVLDDIVTIQHDARDVAGSRRRREGTSAVRPVWPMIVLRTPKGWTGPKEVDGVAVEGTWRSHQVPVAETRNNAEHRAVLEQWLRSYRPEELFDTAGALIPQLQALAPQGARRMSANPHANGGRLLRDLVMPDFRDYAVAVDRPAVESSEATRVLGGFLRDIVACNPDRFRIMGPDETASHRLSAVFEATGCAGDATMLPGDDHLSPDGRVMEVLSEHLCQGWHHPAAATYAVPLQWRDRYAIRRYGFHGLSHAYCSHRAAHLLDRPLEDLRMVTCHLGAGASLAAVVGGRSVDTTMGFTPLEGLVMATRSGTVDPGLVLWLEEHAHLSPHEVATALEQRSGLTALAGTGDMRDVEAAAKRGDPAAVLALDVYTHRLVGSIGAMSAATGGVDVLVFTGGVGEHSSMVRRRAVERLGFLGVAIDTHRNDTVHDDGDITAATATVRTLVITAREDLQIAREARRLLGTR